MSLRFWVERVYDAGRVLEKHMRHATRKCGTITIKQVRDSERGRAVLVATLHTGMSTPTIPPLHDVVLVHGSDARWSLAGYERIETGGLRQQHTVAQTWVIELAEVQELIDAERKWGEAAGEAYELRERLKKLIEQKGGDT